MKIRLPRNKSFRLESFKILGSYVLFNVKIYYIYEYKAFDFYNKLCKKRNISISLIALLKIHPHYGGNYLILFTQ